MKLLLFTNIKSNNIVQQTQPQQFKLVGNTTRKCASLKIQGNIRCSSCGGK